MGQTKHENHQQKEQRAQTLPMTEEEARRTNGIEMGNKRKQSQTRRKKSRRMNGAESVDHTDAESVTPQSALTVGTLGCVMPGPFQESTSLTCSL
jgi:hypothetical protein